MKNDPETGSFTRVLIEDDGDGHTYVVPYGLHREFGAAMELFDEEGDSSLLEAFEQYRLPGALSNVNLFVREAYFTK